jgi:hypothetical protein
MALPPGDMASSVSLFFLSAAISSLFNSMCSARPALAIFAVHGNPAQRTVTCCPRPRGSVQCPQREIVCPAPDRPLKALGVCQPADGAAAMFTMNFESTLARSFRADKKRAYESLPGP